MLMTSSGSSLGGGPVIAQGRRGDGQTDEMGQGEVGLRRHSAGHNRVVRACCFAPITCSNSLILASCVEWPAEDGCDTARLSHLFADNKVLQRVER